MTHEEFKKRVEEFSQWTSTQERPASCWFFSLACWAKMEYERAYKQEHPTEKKKAS